MHKFTIVLSVLIAIVGGGCHAKDEEFYMDKLFDLAPNQKEFLSNLLARGIITLLANRIKTKYASHAEIGTKGIPLFPEYKEHVCVNMTEFGFNNENIGLRYNHKMLTDLEITGLNGVVDSLDIYVDNTDPDLPLTPLTFAWRVDTALVSMIGDYIMELEFALDPTTANSTVTSQATNFLFEIEDAELMIAARAKLFPINETMAFYGIDFYFNSTRLTWVADWRIEQTGSPPWERRYDVGPRIKELLEGLVGGGINLITPIISCMLNYIIEDCSITGLLEDPTCLKIDLGILVCLTPTILRNDDDFSNSWTGNWNALGENQCPAVEVTTPTSTTTTRDPGDGDSGAMGILGGQNPLFFITTILMYMVTRFVVV